MATKVGASDRRVDRWLRAYAGDLGPLDDEVRSLLRRRLTARRRASRPVVVLGLLAIAVLVTAYVRSFWIDDVAARGREWAGWYLLVITMTEGMFLLQQQVTRRAEARVAATLTHRVARGEHAGVATVLGRVGLLAAVVSCALAVGWSIVLLTRRADALTYAWAACVGMAVLVGALGLGRAMGRPTIAMDPVSLAIDERLRAEESATAVTPLWMIWMAISPAMLGLQGLPRWAGTGIALSAVVVMTLTLWGMLQRIQRRPGPKSHR